MRTRADYLEMLGHHLNNLSDCAKLYDAGRHSQAFNIALTLRALFHNGGGDSLMRLLNANTQEYECIAGFGQTMAETMAKRDAGLLTVTMYMTGGGRVPVLDLSPRGRRLPFPNWWADDLVQSDETGVHSRADIVTLLANKDGPAHVQPSIPRALQRLRDGVGTYTSTDQNGNVLVTELTNQHWRIVRMIAAEVLLTAADPNFLS